MQNDRLMGTVQAAVATEPEGLRDGGHNYLSCSNCRAMLMDVFITRPHEPELYKVRATCPWCGDTSFVADIRGGFHYGGYGVLKPGDDDEDVASTVVDRSEMVKGVFVFHILKASVNAQPVHQR